MKSSKIKHILITSVIFLCIILIIVIFYQKQLDAIPKEAKHTEPRVVVTADIKPGDPIVYGEKGNVELREVQPVLSVENLAKSLDEVKGKIAIEAMYKGEMVTTNRVKSENEIYKNGERLYPVTLDSAATGGYNISKGEYVDICVLYDAKSDYGTNPIVNGYQNLPANKLIDVVLAKRMITDIVGESGERSTGEQTVKPGFVYFRLTYDEINKLELAKKQGKLFIGKVKNYIGDPHQETFMQGVALPSIT